jgi:Dolichol kinase
MSELGRRLAHTSGTLVPVAYLLNLLTWFQIQVLVTAGAALAVVLEAVRLGVGLDWWVYARLTREYESDAPAGYALAVVAVAVVVWVFVPPVAVAAVLMLTVGDPVAGVLGSGGVGERKALWVMAVTAAVCLAIGLAFVAPRAAAPAALVVTLADSYTPRVAGYVIDDNASIPIGAAVTAAIALAAVPPLCGADCPAPAVTLP